MTIDIMIEFDNDEPGALGHVATALSDAGINISAATHLRKGGPAQLHILVPHAEPVRHALAVVHSVTITKEREVVVVQATDRPGELAEMACKIGGAGVDIDLVYVATGSRIVFGSPDIEGLKAALASFSGQ